MFDQVYRCPIGSLDPKTCTCSSCYLENEIEKSKAAVEAAIARNFTPTGRRFASVNEVPEPVVIRETTREKIERQRRERYAEREKSWAYIQENEARYAAHREQVLAKREAIKMNPNNMYWPPYNPLAPEGEKHIEIEYQWDLSQQENVSIAVLTLAEANEYLDLLIKDTHDRLSTGKDYVGVGMGLKGAYEVVKELGGLGATAKAVNINGVMNIVVENYKPRYLDLGIRWQEATPKMLKIGYALNTAQGNIRFLRGNIYVEVVFSGAVNAVDYMLHDEKTLGEVVGQFTADISKGVVAGVVAQGVTLILRVGLTLAFAAPPTALLLGFFAISAFYIGKKVSELDNQYKYTDPMKKEIERLIDES
ncbi:hypothetical protein [Vibrio metschnikovii]|uniref:hypothetical protein n=1 Tax=Vibrio metschnikovii TaxID=28172 RepID=UPI0020C62FFC|nr:hypothetical protein [Vibrio metschnikovii]